MHAFFKGHSQLLIRAPRHVGLLHAPFPTRIDVLFKAVAFVQLPTVMHGFSLATVDPQDASIKSPEAARSAGINSEIFSVRGSDYAGYVVAEAAFICEDEADDVNAPSALTQDFRITFTPQGHDGTA